MVQYVGDVMYDAALFYGGKADKESNILERLQLDSKKYILATIHRAENTDNRSRLAAIIDGFELSKQTIILPLHPRTKSKLELLDIKIPSNIKLIDPVGYIDMVMLEKNARLIATDSGGVQKEAFFYHIPCVTLRDETEWVELVESGWNRIASPDKGAAAIADLISKALDSTGDNIKPYGNGDSASHIANILLSSKI